MSGSPFFAVLSRMKYINRWGLMRNSRNENLAEHSLEVAFIAHALAVIRNRRFGGSADTGRVLTAALYHDSCEILTGDLPTPVKYRNEAIKNAYKNIETLSTRRLLDLLPEDILPDFEESLICPDSETAALVKAADKISALIKCLEEERMGNSDFSCAQATIKATLEASPLPEVGVFIAEFLPSYGMTLDDMLE